MERAHKRWKEKQYYSGHCGKSQSPLGGVASMVDDDASEMIREKAKKSFVRAKHEQ